MLVGRRPGEVGDDPEDASHSTKRWFFALQLVGGAGLCLVLLTVLLRRLRRSVTWIALCLSLVIYSVSYSLTLLSGESVMSKPSFALCLTQASLIYGAPALTAYSALAFVLEIYLTIRRTSRLYGLSRARLTALLCMPYFISCAIVASAIIIGTNNHATVERAEVYCKLTTGVMGNVTAGLVSLAVVGTLVLEATLIYRIHRNRAVLRQGTGSETSHMPTLPLSSLARITAFSLCAVFVLGISAAIAADAERAVPNLCIAIIPVVALLIFGMQSDMLYAWLPRKLCGPPVTARRDSQVTLNIEDTLMTPPRSPHARLASELTIDMPERPRKSYASPSGRAALFANEYEA